MRELGFNRSFCNLNTFVLNIYLNAIGQRGLGLICSSTHLGLCQQDPLPAHLEGKLISLFLGPPGSFSLGSGG